jgi:hypothetical protein
MCSFRLVVLEDAGFSAKAIDVGVTCRDSFQLVLRAIGGRFRVDEREIDGFGYFVNKAASLHKVVVAVVHDRA